MASEREDRTVTSYQFLVNAGIANACTGEEGIDLARGMTKLAAQHLGTVEDAVLVASTGIIAYGNYLAAT
mgnify:CR=1 FL=1